MNKRFLLAAALCAAMSLGAFAQTNLAKGIVPEKIGTIVTGTNIPETLEGLTDGKMDNIYLLPELGGEAVENAPIQAFSIDLGANYDLGQIKIYWEGAATKDVKISVSDDNNTWTEVVNKADLGQRTEDSFTLAAGTKGRYVKFEATVAVNWGWGVKMKEFEVYQSETPAVTTIKADKIFADKGDIINITTTDQYGDAIETTLDVTGATKQDDGSYKVDGTGNVVIKATDANGKVKTSYVYVVTEAPAAPTLGADDAAIFIDSNEGVSASNAAWNEGFGSESVTDINGKKVWKVTNVGTFGISKTIEGSGYTTLNFDIFPSVDVESAYVNYENSGLTNKTFSLKAGEWNHVSIDVDGATGFSSWIQFYLGKKSATNNPDIYLTNVYLAKKVIEAGKYEVAETADAKGFITVKGTITADNVAGLKEYEGTAFDLTKATIEEGVTKIEFANPNALIMVAGSNTDFATANKLTETNNVITTDGLYFFAANTLHFNDATPINTSISIDTSKGATTGYEYTRELTAGSWSTTTPLTTADVPEGVEAYELDTENSVDNKIVFKKAETLIGGTPYVLHATNAATLKVAATTGDFNPTLDPTSVAAANVTFHGNYQAKKGTKAEYALQNATVGDDNNLTFKKVGEGATIGTFRSYFTLNEGNDEAVVYSISFGGTTTGIGNIQVAKGNQKANGVYTLDGRKVSEGTSLSNLPKGIYIVNGKKIVK